MLCVVCDPWTYVYYLYIYYTDGTSSLHLYDQWTHTHTPIHPRHHHSVLSLCVPVPSRRLADDDVSKAETNKQTKNKKHYTCMCGLPHYASHQTTKQTKPKKQITPRFIHPNTSLTQHNQPPKTTTKQTTGAAGPAAANLLTPKHSPHTHPPKPTNHQPPPPQQPQQQPPPPPQQPQQPPPPPQQQQQELLDRLRQICEHEGVGYTDDGLEAVIFSAEVN
jgi:hypothetical protein